MIIEDRHGVDQDIEETFGLVPEFFKRVPDYLLPTEWASFKSLVLSDETAIPNKYKEMIGLAVSGATRGPPELLEQAPRARAKTTAVKRFADRLRTYTPRLFARAGDRSRPGAADPPTKSSPPHRR